jgi:hypothetical protein
MNVSKKSNKRIKGEKVSPTVVKAVEAFKKGRSRKSVFVPPEKDTEPSVTATVISQVSPSEVEKVEEPTIIRLSKKFGSIGGAALGGLAASKFGMGMQGSALGSKYGGMIAEYGVKRLIERLPILGSFKSGGNVRKTGAYILHKGEKVIPVKNKRRSKY